MSCSIFGLWEIDTTTTWGKVQAGAATIAVALVIIAAIALAGEIVVSILGSVLMLTAGIAVCMLISCWASCRGVKGICAD